jgi:spoIIIJ-associated protein
VGGLALAESDLDGGDDMAMPAEATMNTPPPVEHRELEAAPTVGADSAPASYASAPEPAPRERERDRDRDRGRGRPRDTEYSEPAMDEKQLGETSKQLTEKLLQAMGFEATVSVSAQGDRADVTIEVAQDDDLLTGPKGETRQAMQHLLNRFLNRGEGSRYHLQLEINDFWKRREDELAALARSLAEAALSSNAEMVTEYLNSQERRIVHVTLRENTAVKTYALGTGMIKRVAVAPADFPDRTGEEDAG